MGIKEIFYILGSLIFTIMAIIGWFKILKEIKDIKMSSSDSIIKAKVINWHIFTTGDVRPILSYTVNDEEKTYEYHFFHKRKDFPIGEIISLKLSNASGLAYDKKDIIQGLLMASFTLLLFLSALLFFVWCWLFV